MASKIQLAKHEDVTAVNTSLTTHTGNKLNPHSVTKAQVGLGNVLNVASYSKTEVDNKIASENADWKANDEQIKNDAIQREQAIVKQLKNGTITPLKANWLDNGGKFNVTENGATTTENIYMAVETAIVNNEYESGKNVGFGFNYKGVPTILGNSGIVIANALDNEKYHCISFPDFKGDSYQYFFPPKKGTLALTSDLTNTAHSHSVGNGLSITGSGGTSGTTKYSAKAGSGITVNSNGINVNTSYTTSGKNYKVQIDSKSGGLYVNVPWENTDTNTDTMVTQNKVITTNGNYPVLLAHSTSNAAITGDVNKTSTLLYNPSTKALSAGSFSGSGASLTSLNADNISSGTVAAARLPNATTSAKGAVKIGTGLSVSSGTVSLGTSGAKAGSYGPSATLGGTDCSIPYITVDKYGRVTSIKNGGFKPYIYIIGDRNHDILSKTPVKNNGLQFADSSVLEEYYDEYSYGILKVYWCDDTLVMGENIISEFVFNFRDLYAVQEHTQGVIFHVPNGASYDCWVRLFVNGGATQIGYELLGRGWSSVYDADSGGNYSCSIAVVGLRAGCQ